MWPFNSSYGEAFTVSPSAVFDATASKTVIGVGFCNNITVNMTNDFNYDQTFNVTAFATSQANTTTIGTQQVNNLSASSQTALIFPWNTTGLSYGNYTISAYASPVPDESNTTEKNRSGILATVTIPGDINGDFKVKLADLVLLANAYRTTPASGGTPGALHAWNPNADINGNGGVDLSDLALLANHYGQQYP